MENAIQLNGYLKKKTLQDMILAIVVIGIMLLLDLVQIMFSTIYNAPALIFIIFQLFILVMNIAEFVALGIALRNIYCIIVFSLYGLNNIMSTVITILHRFNFSGSTSVGPIEMQDLISIIRLLSIIATLLITLTYLIFVIIKKVEGLSHIFFIALKFVLTIFFILQPMVYKAFEIENIFRLLFDCLYTLINAAFRGVVFSMPIVIIVSSIMIMKTRRLIDISIYQTNYLSQSVLSNREKYIDIDAIREHQATHMHVYFNETYGTFIMLRECGKIYLAKVNLVDGVYYIAYKLLAANPYQLAFSEVDYSAIGCNGKKGNIATLIAGLVSFGLTFMVYSIGVIQLISFYMSIIN